MKRKIWKNEEELIRYRFKIPIFPTLIEHKISNIGALVGDIWGFKCHPFFSDKKNLGVALYQCLF